MTLHILNGDGTLRAFRDSAIKGDIIVWREILSEGPVKNIPIEDFFQLRSDYICQTFEGRPEEYVRQVVDEFRKIEDSNHYDEIYLWFEHDLLCQINLIFLLTTLSENHFPSNDQTPEARPKTYVIKFYEDEEQKRTFKGLGNLNGKQLAERFEHKTEMKKSSLLFAKSCWTVYAGKNPFEIESMIRSIPEEFPFLGPALKAHLQRFPSTKNGLNALQQLLLEMICLRPLPVRTIIPKFLEEETVYGITDLIALKIIEELTPLFLAGENLISLTESGKSILEGREDFISLYPRGRWLRGYYTDNGLNIPRWNLRTNRLQQI